MGLELFDDDGNYIPKPSETRPSEENPRVCETELPQYMLIGGKVKKVEWVLDVENGFLYPRESVPDITKSYGSDKRKY